MLNSLLDNRTKSIVKFYLPEREALVNLATLFNIFSDATRVKIISALSMSEMCVTDLAEIVSMNQTTLSHQLKLLRQAKIVKTRRHGKIIFYSLASTTVNDIMMIGVRQLGY